MGFSSQARQQQESKTSFTPKKALNKNDFPVPVESSSSLNKKPPCACGGGCPKCAPKIQKKSLHGGDNNTLEKQADAVAEKVMRGNVSQPQMPVGQSPLRSPPIVNQYVPGGGRPMANEARQFFEPRFNTDFSQVRVHTGDQAADYARAFSAKAYTYGNHIVFGKDQYDHHSSSGKRLIAHELAHVEQQSQAQHSRVDRFADCGSADECPARDRGEEAAARTDPMSVDATTDPDGILFSNFAVGSSRIKPGLESDPDFHTVQSGMRGNISDHWEILGFSDCEGSEASNISLRDERAGSLYGALPSDLQSQIATAHGAPLGDCMQSNASVAGRRFNRSAFMRRISTEMDFPEESVEAERPAPSHLYGVTSPASQFFVRTSPNGEIIGQLALSEMRVQVIGESGTNVDNLWLKVRFSRADMDAVQAVYAAAMAPRIATLGDLERRRDAINDRIEALETRPGMRFETRPEIARARRQLDPIEDEIQQIEDHRDRLVTPYTGLTAWVGAAALGVVAMHYDTFLDLVDTFDAAHASEPLRDRLTRLRQFGEDASLEGDTVVGRGGDFDNRVTQSDRSNHRGWELLFEAKQIRMPDGSFIDAHHFILGLDALALPSSAQSSSRVLRSWGIASVNVGESWSATTWSGDVGGAVGDYVLHRSGAWEGANTREDNDDRLRFYFDTRAPEMDLLADIDSWGAFQNVPRTNTERTSFTSLRDIIEATYGPARQTADDYIVQVTPVRRQGVKNFLCNYGFSSPTSLTTQTTARARVLEQVRIFATGWYDARAGGGQPVFGRTDATDDRILEASREMTDMFLLWLQALAATVGLRSLSCGRLPSPLRNRSPSADDE